MKRSERVYLEAYTSLLLVPKEKLVRGAGLHACMLKKRHTVMTPSVTSSALLGCRKSFMARM